MIIDPRGWLIDDPRVSRHPSARTSRLVVPAPLGVVWHWDGMNLTEAETEAMVERIRKRPMLAMRAASWHVHISRTGRTRQSVSFDRGAWHVKGKGLIAGAMRSVNRSTVGIELANAGEVRRRKAPPGWWSWPFNAQGSHVPDTEVVYPGQGIAGSKCYHAFTDAQIAAAEAVLRALVARFGWSREACSYGHRDFTPTKSDPGPAWAGILLPAMLDRIFGGTE